jgi:hypothetical protein
MVQGGYAKPDFVSPCGFSDSALRVSIVGSSDGSDQTKSGIDNLCQSSNMFSNRETLFSVNIKLTHTIRTSKRNLRRGELVFLVQPFASLGAETYFVSRKGKGYPGAKSLCLVIQSAV